MYVTPAINPDSGLPYVIRQPERMYRLMPAEGAEVPHNHFYRRHINDGSLIVGHPDANAQSFDVEILSKEGRS